MRSVLELLASGTIDVDEALELLIALEDTPATETPTATRKARAVHITVERPEAQNINVTIPASLTKIALKLMPKDVREQLSTQGIDPDTVNQLLAGDVPIGRLLELTKDEHGVSTRVTIDAS
jgi:type IV pilus biogenesis protein CpaD/CtpE